MRTLTVVAALAAFVGSFSAASAADLSMKDYGPAPIWSGMYVGGHVGALWNDSSSFDALSCSKKKHSVSTDEVAVRSMVVQNGCKDWENFSKAKFESGDDDVSLIGGIQIGRNWQIGNHVLGVEADVSFADGLEYLGSMRGRVGYAQGNLLLYITGGVAFAGFDNDDAAFSYNGKSYTLRNDDGDDRRIGMVAGVGADYKIRPNMSIGIEGLYYAFDDTENNWAGSIGNRCNKLNYKISENDDNDLFVVRGRLNYHFSDDRDSPLK